MAIEHKSYYITKDSEWGVYVVVYEATADAHPLEGEYLKLNAYQLEQVMCQAKKLLGWHSQFRVGDKVVCIDDSGTGQESADEESSAITAGLRKGQMYEIEYASRMFSDGSEAVNLVGITNAWGCNRFELVRGGVSAMASLKQTLHNLLLHKGFTYASNAPSPVTRMHWQHLYTSTELGFVVTFDDADTEVRARRLDYSGAVQGLHLVGASEALRKIFAL